MSSKTTFYVPVKPFVRQYFIKEYGADPILVVSNNLLGMLVMTATDKLPYRVIPKRPANREEMLALRMPKRLQGRTMSDSQRESLSKILDKLFYTELYNYIRSQAAVTGSEWAALRCFAAVYELDTELFDIDKAYKLWRDKKQSILSDNRQATEEWYAKHRLHPDDTHEHAA